MSDEALADEVHGLFLRLERLGLVVDRVELPRAYVTALRRTGAIQKGRLWGAPLRLGPKVEVVGADPVILFRRPRPLVAKLTVSGRKVTMKKARMKPVWVPT